MITSPTEKGVIIIGGWVKNNKKRYFENFNAIMEMSGDTVENLKWTILDKKLQYPRSGHASIPISNKVFNNLNLEVFNDLNQSLKKISLGSKP